MGLCRRHGRRLSRALVAATAVLVLLVGVLRANARYFYCPLMDAVASRSCCAAPHGGAAQRAPALEAPDCCEEMRVGALPSGAATASLEVSAAPLTALVPSITAAPPRPVHVAHGVRLDALHRGPPRPGEARARAMVFLI